MEDPNQQTSATTTDGYEIALDVLLSLGNPDHATSPGAQGIYGGDATSAFSPPPPPQQHHEQPSSLHRTLSGSPLVDHPSTLSISPEREVELLRHYRYEVAPWLDICDLGQAFGVAVALAAAECQRLYHGLLALASATLTGQPSSGETECTQFAALSNAKASKLPFEDFETREVCAVVDKTRQAVCGLTSHGDKNVDKHLWPDHALCELVISALASVSNPRLAVPAYYLALRLELSTALITEQSLSLPLRSPQEIRMPWESSDLSSKTFHAASESLVLCARALHLQSQDHGTLIHAWTSLVEDLQSWFSQRPQEFKPVVEIDVPSQTFPVVLFTSGAGVLGNQLYHTAMLLLLQSRPRTVRLPSHHHTGSNGGRSATMSALWHAQRICGIALNNDRRECWDPSLLSSLVVAAKRMTHDAQHQAILSGLEHIEGITGWKTAGLADMLRNEWGIESATNMAFG